MNRYTLLTTVLMSLSFGVACGETQRLELRDGSMVVNYGTWWGLPTVDTSGSTLVQPEATYLVNTVNKQITLVGNGSTGPQVAFEDIGIEEGSSTGTPGALLFKNYIGSIDYTLSSDKSVKNRAGSGKRLYFCDGECIKK